MVLLHGVGSNEQSLLPLASAIDPRLHVLLPRGPVVFGPQAFGWFTVRFDAQGPVIDPAQAETSRLLLADWLAGQQQRLDWMRGRPRWPASARAASWPPASP